MSPIDAIFAQDVLHRLYAAVNDHGANAVATLCCDDVVWEDPAAAHTEWPQLCDAAPSRLEVIGLARHAHRASYPFYCGQTHANW